MELGKGPQKSSPAMSFVTPIYNEEGIIAVMLQNLHEVIEAHPEWNAEVILVEDGSKDSTRSILETEVPKYPEMQLVLHETNMGYTPSLKDGLARARGSYIMYVGADEEFECSEIPNFVNILLEKGAGHADLVLGVRWQRNAYKLHRFFMSIIYIFFLNFMFKVRFNDYNWSQAWSRELIEKINLRSKSLFILPEIIVRAHDLGYKIREIPSNHRGRQHGKSSLNIKIFGFALIESLKFWWYRRSKKYSPIS